MINRTNRIVLVALGAIALAATAAALLELPAHAQQAPPPPLRPQLGPRTPLFPRALGVPTYTPPRPAGTSSGPRPQPAANPQPSLPLPPPGEAVGEPGEAEFNRCLKVPVATKVRSTLKPDSDLADLVQFVESFTCKRFVYSSMVRSAKATVWMPEEVTPAEAYRIFLSALETMGLTVVPAGPVLKIVETMRAREEGLPIYATGQPVPATDQMVTRLFRLDHAVVEEVVPVLNTVKSKDGLITPYAPTNSIIVSDTGRNIDSMADLLGQIDVAGAGDKIFLIKLKNASAEDIKARLDEVFAKLGQKGPGGALRAGNVPAPPPEVGAAAGGAGASLESASELHVSEVIADARTNSLIVVATERSYLEVLALVQKLDIPIAGSENMIHVFTLQNGDATQIAQTLTQIVSGLGARGAGGVRPAQAGGPPGETGSAFEGQVRVTADKSTNSLVVVAGLKDYLELSDVIKQLDQPRRQVFVEAAILEISIDRDRKLGMAFHAGDTANLTSGGQSLFFGASESSNLSSFTINPAALAGLLAGLIGPPIPNAGTVLGLPPGTSIPSFGVMLQAIQTNNDVNVLSTPHILTTDNEKAEISVGQNVPYLGSSFGGAGGLPGAAGGAAGQTSSFLPYFGTPVQRMDVALKLGLTPHINQGDFVRLDVDIEISDIFAANYNGLGPATNKRTAKTVVVVKDQQTAVLGGLMSNKTLETQTKVPLLGDIPIIGYLFRFTENQSQKTDLVLFLTPYIIRDPSDLRRIFERKVEERREFIERNTAFQSTLNFEANVDYRRKRGLIDEIDAEADEVEGEMEQYEQVRRPRGVAEDLGEVTPEQAISAPRKPEATPSPAPAPGPAPRAVTPPSSRPAP